MMSGGKWYAVHCTMHFPTFVLSYLPTCHLHTCPFFHLANSSRDEYNQGRLSGRVAQLVRALR